MDGQRGAPVIPYASPGTPAPPPPPSPLVIPALVIYVLVAIGKVAVLLYGVHRWQTYRMERLYRLFVEPNHLIEIAEAAYAAGACIALLALLHPRRERHAALFALILNAGAFLWLWHDMHRPIDVIYPVLPVAVPYAAGLSVAAFGLFRPRLRRLAAMVRLLPRENG